MLLLRGRPMLEPLEEGTNVEQFLGNGPEVNHLPLIEHHRNHVPLLEP